MKPGRELDALVAEKVMGCKVWRRSDALHAVKDQAEYERLRLEFGRNEIECGCAGKPHEFFIDKWDSEGDLGLKQYSNDIAAAFEVISKLGNVTITRDKWYDVTTDKIVIQWSVLVPDKKIHAYVVSDSPAAAICAAALDVVAAGVLE